MERAELEARAIQRAKDERVRIWRVEGTTNVYRTRSKSNPNEWYSLVADNETDIFACSCKGYEFRKSCKHASALRLRLARETRRRSKNVYETYTTDSGNTKVYHKADSGSPQAHKDGDEKPWYFEPTSGWAEGEVFSNGYATAKEALEAAEAYELDEDAEVARFD
jgi:hypothetical protein